MDNELSIRTQDERKKKTIFKLVCFVQHWFRLSTSDDIRTSKEGMTIL
jgi:hypothetical protein